MGVLHDRFGRPGGDGLGGVVEQGADPFDLVRGPAAAVHVQGMAFVSCKTKDGIAKLRDLLVGIAKNKLAPTLNEVPTLIYSFGDY